MLNSVVLQGRLVDDPEIRTFKKDDEEKIWGKYRLAVGRDRKIENIQNADYVPCVVFGGCAMITANYLRKGMKVIVQGKFRSRSYYNNDGTKVYTVEVIVTAQYFDFVKEEIPERLLNIPEDGNREEVNPYDDGYVDEYNEYMGIN